MIVLLFTILSAIYDSGKRFQDHSSRFIFRAVVILLISFFEMPVIIGMYKPTLFQFIFNISVFYLFFDYVLNIIEGREWNYIGTTAKIDILWNKLGGWVPQLTFKLIFLITLILIK